MRGRDHGLTNAVHAVAAHSLLIARCAGAGCSVCTNSVAYLWRMVDGGWMGWHASRGGPKVVHPSTVQSLRLSSPSLTCLPRQPVSLEPQRPDLPQSPIFFPSTNQPTQIQCRAAKTSTSRYESRQQTWPGGKSVSRSVANCPQTPHNVPGPRPLGTPSLSALPACPSSSSTPPRVSSLDPLGLTMTYDRALFVKNLRYAAPVLLLPRPQ